MNIKQKLRGAMRRIVEVSLAGGVEGKRRTVPLPSILNTYGPRPDAYPKPSPANLRRFAETPVARKAINTIKDQIAGMRWRIQPRPGRGEQLPDADLRIRILTDNFDAPNPDDSFRSLAEQVLEDVIVGGFGAIEIGSTGDLEHPLSLWPVDGATIRIKGDWDGLPGSPHYVQVTNRYGAQVNRYAARLASNSVVEYALWLQGLTAEHHERLIRWWQDEIEGTGRVPILSFENKPEVLRFGGGTDADLRLQWQEFLLRIIADAFDLPPQSLGLERDVNRSTAAEMNDQAFRQAIVPTARLFAEHLTRDAICKKLGWDDLEFVFTDVDGPGDAMEEAQIQQILIQSGVLTVNEVRRMRGLPPL